MPVPAQIFLGVVFFGVCRFGHYYVDISVKTPEMNETRLLCGKPAHLLCLLLLAQK